MAFVCKQCHLKEQSVQPLMACATCHPARSELHLKPTHSSVACATCHVPHEWKAAKREDCLGCHQDKTAHNPPAACKACHSFRQVAKAS